MLSITDDEDYLENPDKQVRVKELEREVNRSHYMLYNLIDEGVEIMEKFSSSR